MRKFQWNEEDVQSVLKQMPVVSDRRSKQEVYELIKRGRERMQKRTRIVPAFVSVAAACLLLMIGASLFSSPPTMNEKAQESRSELSPMDGAESADKAFTMQAEKSASVPSRIVPSGDNVIVFGLPDPTLQAVIPVSIAADGQDGSLERQIEAAKTKLAEPWGLDSRWFDEMEMSPSPSDKRSWIVRVGKGHPVFSSGSASESMFLLSIEETVRALGGANVQFFTGDAKGMKLPHSGYVQSINIPRKPRAYYFYRLDDAHPLFLAPSAETFKAVEAALDSMKNIKSGVFRPSIRADVTIASVQKQGGELIIEFTADSALDGSPDSQWMLEAMLMTAKEFGFRSVTFTGGNVEEVGPYRFGEAIPVPAAPNPMPLE